MKQSQMDGKVRQLLGKMTVEEKVGQMTQLTLEQFAKSGQDGYLVLDEQKLRDGIVNHHLGSILNCGGQARTVQNWQEIITKMQDVATKETRLGIPSSMHRHNPRGQLRARRDDFSAEYRDGRDGQRGSDGKERRDFRPRDPGSGHPVEPRARARPGPPADVASRLRDPRRGPLYRFDDGGRLHPRQQGDDISNPLKVAVCMKHYLGYSWPQSGRDRTPGLYPGPATA